MPEYEPPAETAKKKTKAEIEAAELEGLELRTGDLRKLGLMELVHELTPHHRPPEHLKRWVEIIEASAHNATRALCSIPIRHYKTETTVHGIVYLLLKHPEWRIIFMTHSAEAASKWGKRIRQIAEATTVGPRKDWDTIAEWRNKQGGGVVVMSADQSKIGYDCDALIVDDPLDELSADDFKTRDAVDEAISMYTARCMRDGRRGPVLIVASRFHPDDPIGRRLLRKTVEWEYVCHAAITTDERGDEHAFAGDVWPLDELRKVRAELAEKDPSERIWWAQFQNNPKPLGSDLFGPATFYPHLPDHSFRIAYGADLAYTSGASSDYFAMVAAKIMPTGTYILEVQRHKLDAHLLESTMRAMQSRHGAGPIYSYVSGPEKGTIVLLREHGLPLIPLPARYNKIVRAQRTVKRWNDGAIKVPTAEPWLNGFLHRVGCFRGNDHDDGDDEVDALVSLCDGALGGAAAGASPRGVGTAYPGLYAVAGRGR